MGKDVSDDLVHGTLAMLILKTLSTGELMHGCSIANAIQQTSEDVLRVDEGSLYPGLHRLEVRGLLRSEWVSPRRTAGRSATASRQSDDGSSNDTRPHGIALLGQSHVR